eukprot:EG_transcript_16403
MGGSATDEAVQREIWKGEVPVEYTLADSEVAVIGKPPPFYQLIPRMSYLPFYLPDVRNHFAPAAVKLGQDKARMWLSHNNAPVKWHLPLGVIYDMIHQDSDPAAGPVLQLTVHFDGFPEGKVLSLQTEEDVGSFFLHSMKEAACIRFDSAKAVITLTTKDKQELCEAVRDCYSRFSSYQKVREKIEQGEKACDKLAVRLVVRSAVDAPGQFRLLLRTARRDQTVGQLLHATLPAHFPTVPEGAAASPSATAVLHGVTPLAAMPLRFVAKCSHPDLWIYLVVLLRPTDPEAGVGVTP